MRHRTKKYAVILLAITAIIWGTLATPAANAATGKVTGTVTWNGPSAAGGTVEVMRWEPSLGEWAHYGLDTVIPANGRFTISAIPAGKYSLSVFSDYATTWLGNKTVLPASPSAVGTFTISSGATVSVGTIALTEYMPQVTVNYTGFTPSKMIQVEFFDLSHGYRNVASRMATAAGTANATLRLRPGQYWITARSVLDVEAAATQRPFAENSALQVKGTAPISVTLTGAPAQNRLYLPYADIFGELAVGKTLSARARGGYQGVPELSPTLKQYWSDGTKVLSRGSTLTIPASVLGTNFPVVTIASQAPGQVSRIVVNDLWNVVPAIALGQAPAPRTVPGVVGKPRVGATLEVAHGSWAPTPSSYRYQWNRNGKAIPGATKSSYQLRPSDAGKRISVAVAGVRAGHKTQAITTANTGKVAKAKTSIAVKSVKKSVKRGARAAVKVRVKARGAVPTGRITVKFGNKIIKAKLNKKGRATVRSAKLNSSGTVKIRVKYVGTKAFVKATKKAQVVVR